MCVSLVVLCLCVCQLSGVIYVCVCQLSGGLFVCVSA